MVDLRLALRTALSLVATLLATATCTSSEGTAPTPASCVIGEDCPVGQHCCAGACAPPDAPACTRACTAEDPAATGPSPNRCADANDVCCGGKCRSAEDPGGDCGCILGEKTSSCAAPLTCCPSGNTKTALRGVCRASCEPFKTCQSGVDCPTGLFCCAGTCAKPEEPICNRRCEVDPERIGSSPARSPQCNSGEVCCAGRCLAVEDGDLNCSCVEGQATCPPETKCCPAVYSSNPRRSHCERICETPPSFDLLVATDASVGALAQDCSACTPRLPTDSPAAAVVTLGPAGARGLALDLKAPAYSNVPGTIVAGAQLAGTATGPFVFLDAKGVPHMATSPVAAGAPIAGAPAATQLDVVDGAASPPVVAFLDAGSQRFRILRTYAGLPSGTATPKDNFDAAVAGRSLLPSFVLRPDGLVVLVQTDGVVLAGFANKAPGPAPNAALGSIGPVERVSHAPEAPDPLVMTSNRTRFATYAVGDDGTFTPGASVTTTGTFTPLDVRKWKKATMATTYDTATKSVRMFVFNPAEPMRMEAVAGVADPCPGDTVTHAVLTGAGKAKTAVACTSGGASRVVFVDTPAAALDAASDKVTASAPVAGTGYMALAARSRLGGPANSVFYTQFVATNTPGCTKTRVGACDVLSCTNYPTAEPNPGSITFAGGASTFVGVFQAFEAYSQPTPGVAIFSAGQTLTVSATGNQVPPLPATSLVAPGAAPMLTSPRPSNIGKVTLSLGADLPVTWAATPGVTIGFTMRQTPPPDAYRFVRCSFDGALGAGVVPAAALAIFSGADKTSGRLWSYASTLRSVDVAAAGTLWKLDVSIGEHMPVTDLAGNATLAHELGWSTP